MDKKLLYDASWIKLYKNKDDYVYAERKNKDSIAALCFKWENNKPYFLIHYQPLIEIENSEEIKLYPCLVTGSLEKGKTNEEIARHELHEEVGIKNWKTLKQILTYKFVSTTQMNEIVEIFLFDITNIELEKPKTDGSYYENLSYNKWVNFSEFKNIVFSSNDFILSSLAISYLLFIEFLASKKGEKNENKKR